MSAQEAINKHCKSCIYDSESGNGTWREQTEGCQITQCSLYEYRPLTMATKKKKSQEKFDLLSDAEKAIELEKRNKVRERFSK